MDEIAALVLEKERAREAAQASGLSDVGFAVHWQLNRDNALTAAGLDTVAVAHEVESVVAKFPNWAQNADERRRLRLNLYKPVIGLPDEQRKAAVEQIMQVLERTAED
ncbi:hypothetical protein E4P41_16560 [Geodermatophilus sp. DF01-2]|uniref:hypothetical protein n=1 Tax=Geodermatophilus sp. DF01-2 TaxID=2559610 RepID=UPI001073D575|nr:hypothetical protein [Geodermatophilus sp. DF01_2]TFV55839.1 hypothetical protein E4P41_16560 [Geodermatophilus sp. DF01_2]